MTISLGRLLAITMVLTIFAIAGIFAMDVYANLQEVGHQYTTKA